MRVRHVAWLTNVSADELDVSQCFSAQLKQVRILNSDVRSKLALADLVTKQNFDEFRSSVDAQASVPFAFDGSGSFDQFRQKREEFERQFGITLDRSEVIGRVEANMPQASLAVIDDCIRALADQQHAGLRFTANTKDANLVELRLFWNPPEGSSGQPLVLLSSKLVNGRVDGTPDGVLFTPPRTIPVNSSVVFFIRRNDGSQIVHALVEAATISLPIQVPAVPVTPPIVPGQIVQERSFPLLRANHNCREKDDVPCDLGLVSVA